MGISVVSWASDLQVACVRTLCVVCLELVAGLHTRRLFLGHCLCGTFAALMFTLAAENVPVVPVLHLYSQGAWISSALCIVGACFHSCSLAVLPPVGPRACALVPRASGRVRRAH